MVAYPGNAAAYGLSVNPSAKRAVGSADELHQMMPVAVLGGVVLVFHGKVPRPTVNDKRPKWVAVLVQRVG